MGKLKIGRIPLGMYQTNCYFLYNEGSEEAIVFDPADSGDFICERLSEMGLKTVAVFLTHGHFDHIFGVNKLREISGAKVYAFEEEKTLLIEPDVNCSASVGRSESVKADEYISDLQVFEIAGLKFQAITTPGHTKGSGCFYFAEEKVLISGDTLFEGSVGRTDLPTGSMSELIRSIKDKLMVLDDDVKVYPGHGADTTIGYEREYNPFL